jgi:predicted Ser/Thr protein kinase
MIGDMIGNHRVLSQIGKGGMGTVYQAEDVQLGRKVAIKLLNPSVLARGGEELERFRAEAKVQANINHPNVVTLYGFEPYGESYCMIMEYVEGRTLADLVRGGGPLPPHIVLMIARQILEGLDASHRRGVVHRDLKPSNIILTSDGIVKVMDFGIAKMEGGKNLTATGALVGTVNYMSPEQVRGEAVDARSDLYSFGVILFELLTGQVPFKEESDFSIMLHHVQTPPPPPTQLLPDIPSQLEDIVLRCLNKPPGQRFQSAGEIVAALDAFEEQERALGRGSLYGRKVLAGWIAQPAPMASAESRDMPTAHRMPVDVPLRPAHAEALPPPAQVAPLGAERPNSFSGKGLTAAIVLVIVVLAGASLTWYRMHRLAVESSAISSGELPASSEQASMALDASAVNAAAVEAVETAPAQTAASEQRAATATSQPTKLAAGWRSSSPQAAASPEQKAFMPRDPGSGAAAQFRAAVPAPVPSAVVTRIPDQDASPSGFMIFVDLDQSSEPLPLAAAQARIADILREAGHEVLSAGIVSAHIRTALDRNDLAEVRRNGVGYVVLGTARASLASQPAYGSTYYSATVSLRLELAGMSNGSIVAGGSGEAKSRGSADADAALSEALLNAASQAARELGRNFKKDGLAQAREQRDPGIYSFAERDLRNRRGTRR